MKKVANVEELNALRDKLKAGFGMRHDAPDNVQIVVRMGTCGLQAGARDILSAITKEVGRLDLQNITVAHKDCGGSCENEPVVEVIVPGKEAVIYDNMDVEKAVKVVNELVSSTTHRPK